MELKEEKVVGKDRFLITFLFSVLLVILSGCWDEVQIEERAFLSIVAIDLAEDNNEKTKLELTEQIIAPAGLGTIMAPGEGKAYRIITSTGEGVFETNRNISRQENRKMDVEHLRLIIISKELAEQDNMFANVLDFFIRQQYMRRGIFVIIADEKAKDLLNVEPEHVKIPADYITEIIEHAESVATMKPVHLGNVQEKLLIDRSFTVPLLSRLGDNSIFYEGIAVFANQPNKLIDTLTGADAKGRQFIVADAQEGSITTKLEGDPVTYEIMGSDSKYKLLNRDKNALEFHVDITLKAAIREYYGTADFYKKEDLKMFEQALEDEIKKLSEVAVRKMKDELQVDVLDFDNYLGAHHPKIWNEVKQDWDHGENYFSKSKITINVKATITEPGTAERVRRGGVKKCGI